MIKIKLQAYSWIAGSLGLSDRGTSTIIKTVEKGMTVKELFTVIASEHPEFADKVYNPAAAKFSNKLILIINHKMVRDVDIGNIVLKEGDVIYLTPVFSGG
jgi:hypothetical protein